MTNEDRQVLIANCEVLKQVVECQLQQDEAWRFLALALQNHFPNLKAEYQAARQKDSLFATGSNVALGKLTDKIEEIIEHLKRLPPATP
jgi:hypothetical protein